MANRGGGSMLLASPQHLSSIQSTHAERKQSGNPHMLVSKREGGGGRATGLTGMKADGMHLPSFITEMLRTAGHQAIAAPTADARRTHKTPPTTIRKTASLQAQLVGPGA